MNPTEQRHHHLRALLADLVHRQDGARLRELLAGRGLPAVGPDLRPADLLLGAVESPPDDADLRRRLAACLAPLVTAAATRVAAGTPTPDDQAYLHELWSLAAGLPRNADLFAALSGFVRDDAPLLPDPAPELASALRRALCNQQTDDRLLGFWFALLGPRDAPWDDARRSELLDAWRGLVTRLNPFDEAPMARLSAALVRLHDTVIALPGGERVLLHALLRLEQAYPTALGSPGLVAALAPHWRQWPAALQEAAGRVWPGLTAAKGSVYKKLGPETPEPLTPSTPYRKVHPVLQKRFTKKKPARIISSAWERVGSGEGLGGLVPGPKHTIVRNTETGEAREVYHTGDLGEAIEDGQFTDRDVSRHDKKG